MIKLYSYGKINLFLDIEGKLSNGYHLIKSVMQSIELHDEILLKNTDKDGIIIKCSNPDIPVDEANTCFKAASEIKEKYKIYSGVIIEINKYIPSEAGLGGGSSNCASVIRGLNTLWDLNMSENEMWKIGLKIGADVPFCLKGGTYLVEGIGEKLNRINDFVWNDILLVKPDFSMSTSFVYNKLVADYYNSYADSKILNHINSDDFKAAAMSVSNTLEKTVESFNPKINDIKKLMIQNGALSSCMTGSGSAVFGLYSGKADLDCAYGKIASIYPNTFKTRTITEGTKLFI
jgi:4-diphosphocytidyl-2-C-methyl-D-erythritol kinase